MVLVEGRYAGAKFYRRHLRFQIRHPQKVGRKARLLAALAHQIGDNVRLLQFHLHKCFF